MEKEVLWFWFQISNIDPSLLSRRGWHCARLWRDWWKDVFQYRRLDAFDRREHARMSNHTKSPFGQQNRPQCRVASRGYGGWTPISLKTWRRILSGWPDRCYIYLVDLEFGNLRDFSYNSIGGKASEVSKDATVFFSRGYWQKESFGICFKKSTSVKYLQMGSMNKH